ncbi:MAG: hypothetical protein HC830_03295 [Bacteroidetes bacterium]|nr:hypothetical protein [Bacteroidota bacterium]
MRQLRTLLTFFFVTLAPGCGQAQVKPKPDIKLVFYNVENFFDWENDPQTNDEEFLPEGSRRWTKFRFEEKARNLFKVLLHLEKPISPILLV